MSKYINMNEVAIKFKNEREMLERLCLHAFGAKPVFDDTVQVDNDSELQRLRNQVIELSDLLERSRDECKAAWNRSDDATKRLTIQNTGIAKLVDLLNLPLCAPVSRVTESVQKLLEELASAVGEREDYKRKFVQGAVYNEGAAEESCRREAEMRDKIRTLQAWKDGQLKVWEEWRELMDLVALRDDVTIGDNIIKKAIELIKERDNYKASASEWASAAGKLLADNFTATSRLDTACKQLNAARKELNHLKGVVSLPQAGTFEAALLWMRQGKKVKRKPWQDEDAIVTIQRDLVPEHHIKEVIVNAQNLKGVTIPSPSLLAHDWEIVP